MSVLRDSENVWVLEKPQRARRAVWRGFGGQAVLAGTPIPSQRVVHDHGVVEIMRGCPQGCRFCSAGVYYRPYRMKDREVIDTEVSYLVDVLGYREITLSSLSSGDSRDIFGLFRFLNEKYGMRAIRSSTKVKMNVTVSTFVPKPHTPFQWARQLPPSEADDQLRRTKELLKRLGIKMGYPDPFTSALEGFLEGENPDWAIWWKSEGPVSQSPEELSLRFSQDRAEGRVLKRTLMAILDEDYKQLRIHRLTSLARDAEGQPVDYFSALAASQSFSS